MNPFRPACRFGQCGILAVLLLMPTIATAQAQQSASPPRTERVSPGAKITKEQATKIALERVPGEVTDVAIERKGGKNVYVIEIQTPQGERDVFVDMESGKVVGTD